MVAKGGLLKDDSEVLSLGVCQNVSSINRKEEVGKMNIILGGGMRTNNEHSLGHIEFDALAG